VNKIPLCRPTASTLALPRLERALASGQLVAGQQVRELEALLSARLQGRRVCAVSSGTAALHLALVALGVGPGDEIVVPAVSFPAPINMVERMGATPVPVDVDPHRWAIDPALLRAKLTPNTRAVIAVDPFGAPAPWAELRAALGAHSAVFIEDAACSLGAHSALGPCGALAPWACLSFHPRKIITTAEGGAVVVPPGHDGKAIERLASHGFSPVDPPASRFESTGYNYRLSDIHAALGIPQLQALDAHLAERELAAKALRQRLLHLPVAPMPALFEPGSVVQSFVVLLPSGVERSSVMAHLAHRGIESTIASYSAHRLPYYARKYGFSAAEFPVAEAIHSRGMTLPFYAELQEEDMDRIARALEEVLCA
jgi:dTDP-4-amino-4,6-dideoxygalactose transaminase